MASKFAGPISRDVLDTLYAQVGQTIHLAQMDAGQVLYVEKRTAIRPVEMFSQAGKVGPAYCTGVGKAMLAYLDDVTLEAALQKQAFYQHTQFTHADAESLKTELSQIQAEGFPMTVKNMKRASFVLPSNSFEGSPNRCAVDYDNDGAAQF